MTTASIDPIKRSPVSGVIEQVNLASRSNAFARTGATTGSGGLSESGKECWEKRCACTGYTSIKTEYVELSRRLGVSASTLFEWQKTAAFQHNIGRRSLK